MAKHMRTKGRNGLCSSCWRCRPISGSGVSKEPWIMARTANQKKEQLQQSVLFADLRSPWDRVLQMVKDDEFEEYERVQLPKQMVQEHNPLPLRI